MSEDSVKSVHEGGRIAADIAYLAFGKGVALGMAMRDEAPSIELARDALRTSAVFPRMVAEILHDVMADAIALSQAREVTESELTVDLLTGEWGQP